MKKFVGLALLIAAGLAYADGNQGASADPDPLLLRTSIDLTYEYHLRSADVLVEQEAINAGIVNHTTGNSGIDLSRDVLNVPPFAAIDWELGRKTGLAIGFAAELRKEFPGNSYEDLFSPDNFLSLGKSGNPIAIERTMITKGALYWRSDNLDIIFGRDKVDLGEGLKGSLYPSPRLPYLDAFQAKAEFGRLGMNWIVSTMRASGSWDGVDVDPNQEVSGTPPDDPPYGFEDAVNPTTIIEALHRFTWDFGKFQLGVAADVMYARRNNMFLITDFLPVMSWHQASVLSNNMSLLVDASWEPIEGLRIMGMAGLDEFNATSIGIADSGTPTTPACVLGAKYNGRVGSGAVDAYIEAGYTHYLWGNFDGSPDIPHDVDPLARMIYRVQLDAGDGLIPLTSPYGPGATWCEFIGGLEPTGTNLRLGVDLLVLSKIWDANLVDTPSLTPLADGSTFLFIQAAFPIRWRIGSFELYTTPTVCTESGTWWIEATFGAAYHFRKSTEIGPVK
jgi:hypothetical protein